MAMKSIVSGELVAMKSIVSGELVAMKSFVLSCFTMASISAPAIRRCLEREFSLARMSLSKILSAATFFTSLSGSTQEHVSSQRQLNFVPFSLFAILRAIVLVTSFRLLRSEFSRAAEASRDPMSCIEEESTGVSLTAAAEKSWSSMFSSLSFSWERNFWVESAKAFATSKVLSAICLANKISCRKL